jgi:hypothetical protein
MSVDEHEQERWHVQNLISKPVLVCETATDKQMPPSITLLPASSCSSPHATISLFNTAKTTVPRLQQSDAASGSCSQWWMASTNISCLALHPEDALIHGPSRSPRITPLTLPNCLHCARFMSSSESITLQFAETQCLFFDTLTAGTAADQTLFESVDARLATAHLQVDSNSPFLHLSSTVWTMRLVGHVASNARVDGGGKMNAHQRFQK